MTAPAITVLMPVYNAGWFLREAIDSILHQTFRDFEFLIIDDGSTDDSVTIIQSYSDARIRFIRNDRNVGISETLNKGISLARADLIARMDADDISYPDRLRKQYDYMVANADCALLSTWARVVTEDKKFVRLERYRSNFYYYNLTFECWIYHPTIMFRKQPIQAVGMYSMPYSEDYDLFWKVSVRYRIWNLAEPLLDYRLSSNSLNTVLKKKEYELANKQNVLRNIRYYMGEGFVLSHESLECLRHNFHPIVAQGSIRAVCECLATLDTITRKIIERANVNDDVASIRGAWYFKRRFIVLEIASQLPLHKAIALPIAAGERDLLDEVLKRFGRLKLKKIKNVLTKRRR